ncbi:MAG TPA: cistern family PEP-CTERM protein [Halomicronema sp.]
MSRLSLQLTLASAVLTTAGIWALAASIPAEAFTFNSSGVQVDASDVGQSFTAKFDGKVGDNKVKGLSSEATFKFLGLTTLVDKTEANFEITMLNNSSGNILSRTTALGFDLSDSQGNKLNLLGVGNAGGNSTGNTRSQGQIFRKDFSGEIANLGIVDVCFTDANACNDNSANGVDNNPNTRLTNQATVNATLAFSGSVKQFALSNFGVRYENINGEGYVGATGAGEFKIPTTQKQSIPEPTTVSAVLLAGVLLLSRRRFQPTPP